MLLGLMTAIILRGGAPAVDPLPDLPGLVERWTARDCETIGGGIDPVYEWIGEVAGTPLGCVGYGPWCVPGAIGPLPDGVGGAVYFDGETNFCATGGLLEEEASELTLYFVLRSFDTDEGCLLDVNAGPLSIYANTEAGNVGISGPLHKAEWDGLNGGTVLAVSLSPCRQVVRVDGHEKSPLESPGYVPVPLAGTIVVGGHAVYPEANGVGSLFRGYVAEIIVYRVAHETCQMETMEAALRGLYGL